MTDILLFYIGLLTKDNEKVFIKQEGNKIIIEEFYYNSYDPYTTCNQILCQDTSEHTLNGVVGFEHVATSKENNDLCNETIMTNFQQTKDWREDD